MTTALGDILWISVAAFAGFELALGVNYFLLKFVLRAMHAHAPSHTRPSGPSSVDEQAS